MGIRKEDSRGSDLRSHVIHAKRNNEDVQVFTRVYGSSRYTFLPVKQ